MSKKLVLIDGHSILNRAFYGLPDLTNAEGLHTNAVYGFLNIMFKILEEEKPNFLTVAFDVHEPTFRHKMFDEYKGTRKPMAEELRQQVPLIKEVLTAMGVKIIEKAGYEADDLLGTLSARGEKEGMEVSVISGDRDLLQLATDKVMIRIPKTKKGGTEIENYHASDVKEAYSVTPKEFIDVKALQGDTADNIPGVPGIGEKTAQKLIAQYGTIEAVHENAEVVKPPRASKNIVEYWEQAVLSKTLATIITDVPIEYDFKEAEIASNDALYTEEAYKMFKRLEFKNLLKRFDADAHTEELDVSKIFEEVTSKKKADLIFAEAEGKDVAFYIAKKENSAAGGYKVESDGQLGLFDICQNEEEWLGISICYSKEKCYFIKTGSDITSEYLREKIINTDVKNWYSPELKEEIKAIGWNDSLDPTVDFDKYVEKRKKFADISIAAYLLNPLTGEYPIDNIAKIYLDMMIPTKKELLEKNTLENAFEKDEDSAVKFCCYESYISFLAKDKLFVQLEKENMLQLFIDIEMPMVFVLANMEKEGISIDANALKEYGKNLETGINDLQQRIYETAGEEFNINSPKQLGIILFEKLQLPNGKKTKTGYSTAADVLNNLKADYPIVSDILEYRQLSKLKSTYADGLINYIAADKKIHTTFNQTVTATGRLSSTDPNLQNIPIRIELGKQIRKVFHPADDYVFVDSDYSQIELRVLAHISGDEKLIEAYKEDKDIHRITASQVFHVPFEEVTPLQRRNAKAVNFGIVYGISAFGLSQDIGVSRKEANEYINKYFETYPKIKEFLDSTVENAKKDGFTVTMFGRKRPIPELHSSNFMQKQFGERVAMNSPIQGTAADIIKIAMIKVHDRIFAERLSSRLLLQVHDELLIETKKEELEEVKKILEEEMQSAADLLVPLEIDTEVGNNWYDAH